MGADFRSTGPAPRAPSRSEGPVCWLVMGPKNEPPSGECRPFASAPVANDHFDVMIEGMDTGNTVRGGCL